MPRWLLLLVPCVLAWIPNQSSSPRRWLNHPQTSTTASFQQQEPALAALDDATVVEEEWDEEAIKNFDLPGKSYNDYESELNALSSIASIDEKAVDAAMKVLDEMFQAYVITEDARLYPDIRIYNYILNVLAYSCAQDEATKLAETIYAKLMDTAADTPMPNAETYGTMMDLWMERNNLEKSIHVFEEAISNDTISDHVLLWNKLIQAYGRADAPAKSLQAFDRMKASAIEPNEKTFVQLLRSQRMNGNDLERIWDEELCLPKTVELYNAYLLGQKDAKKAESIVYRMIQEGLSPNTETIHQVLRAYATHGIPSLKLEQFLTLAKGQTIPDRTYAVALQGLSYHPNCSRKPQKAKSILERFENPPSVAALRSAIRACATIPVESYPEDKLEAFRIGMDIYQTAEPKERLHGNALQLAANLLPPGSEKLNALAKAIFEAAIGDGTANTFCVTQFRRAASSSLQLQVFGGDVDDLLQLPADWSRNVDHSHSRQR